MTATKTNKSPQTANITDYAELPADLQPLSPDRMGGLLILGFSVEQVHALAQRRNRRIVEDARLKQRQRRLEIYIETRRMVQQ